MRFTDRELAYVTNKIGLKQAETPEGFLLCSDVCIARTGTQHYLDSELPSIKPKGDGVILAIRGPEEVFKEACIRSFEGKDVTDEHPDDKITPDTYKEHTVGVVLNPRKGEGEFADFIIADLLIKDAVAIAAVRAGKREVSCGYDAEYQQLEPGKARQFNIIGNHVALVERGRCGHACSIGDKAMPVRKGFMDQLRALLKDEDGEGEEEKKDKETKDLGGITLNLHAGPMGSEVLDSKTADAEEEEKKKETMDALPSRVGALERDVRTIKDGVRALLSRDKKAKDADPEDEDEDEEESEMIGDEDEEEKKKEKTEDSARRLTFDSSHLKDEFREVIAGAEIIAPGLQVPKYVRDAAPKTTLDSICLHRRRALAKFATTDDGKSHIKKVTGRFTVRDKMPCAELGVLFNSAVAFMQDKRSSVRGLKAVKDGLTHDTSGIPLSVSDLNRRNREFYSKVN